MARRTALLALLTLALAGVLPALAHAGTVRDANWLERRIVARINDVRAAHGLPRVRYSYELARAADAHSAQMARVGYFAHESANGGAFWRRIERFYPFKGFSSWSVGENLLWRSPDVSPRQAVAMWLASPGHRKVLLTANWRRIGVGAMRATDVAGAYGGRDVVIVTADFGVRFS